MNKPTIFLVILLICGGVLAATQNETENKDGVAYGSAAQRDTAYVDWNSYTYIDLEGARVGISLIFKMLITASDTIIFNTMGANSDPGELGSYYVIRADTLIAGAFGDSIIVINLPYGTGVTTSILPKYVKVQVITADTTGGSAATATIGDSYTWR